MKKIYLSLLALITMGTFANAQCTDLFFSQYIEGSSSNKALEIYNSSNAAIDLSGYSVFLINNGGSPNNVGFSLTGMLAANDVYVIAADAADAAIKAEADTLLAYNSVAHFNGDDAICLIKGTDTIDIIGVRWVDPGSSWTVGTGSTKDFTLTRKATVKKGETDWTTASMQWDVEPKNTFTGLGSHTSNCVTAPITNCSDLFFSQYIEGSSSNKALEIYNSSNADIDLSGYSVFLINNGGSPNNVGFSLTGMLAANEVYIIAADAADAAIKAEADTLLAYNSVAHFNGDDAICLIKGTDTIDIIGVRWVDPGSSWTVGTGSTKDFTLTRKSGIKKGETDWTTASMQWDVLPKNTYTGLGSHSSDCHVPPATSLNFSMSSIYVNETDGSIDVEVKITNPMATMATMVTLTIDGGTAVNGTDYTATSPTTLTFPAGSSTNQKFSVSITDNMVAALDKTITLSLSSPTGGALLGNDSTATINIENDDYRAASIKDMVTNDADMAVMNQGLKMQATGVVYGIDYDGNAGISFTIIDDTDGINIFNFADVNDYVVTEGDEITVRGEIGFYNGLTELIADSIKVNSNGNTLKNPTKVDKPSEATESDFIRIEKVWLVDTNTTWPDNRNLMLTNEMKDTFQIRIDRDITDMVGVAITFDTMTIKGIGGQYDRSSPYTDGYQIFPRRLSDVTKYSSVSVKDLDLNFVRVYPNPTNDVLNIESTYKIKSINVLTINGKVVSKTNSHQVSLKDLSTGVYLIRIETENGVATKKIAVQH